MLPSVILLLLLITHSLGDPLTKHLKFNPYGRIVNTNYLNVKNVTIKANPWMVSLQMFGIHNCGGVIINSNTILTAAHCCTELTKLYYKVVAGTADLNKATIRVPIRETIIHEHYGYDYDIAILKLDVNLKYDYHIQPIILPSRGLTNGEILKLTGWAKSRNSTITSNFLQSIDVKLVDRQICIEEYENYSLISSRMICAGRTVGGEYVDYGDDGGPLTKNGVLYGIASHGKVGSPYVYTNVFALNDWIREKADL